MPELQNNHTLLLPEREEKDQPIEVVQMEHELLQTAVSIPFLFFFIILKLFSCIYALFAAGLKAITSNKRGNGVNSSPIGYGLRTGAKAIRVGSGIV